MKENKIIKHEVKFSSLSELVHFKCYLYFIHISCSRPQRPALKGDGGCRWGGPTQRHLLQQVQVAGEELAPERVVQVEGHAVATHGVIRLLPAVPERLMGSFVLQVRRRVGFFVVQGGLHVRPRNQKPSEGGEDSVPSAAGCQRSAPLTRPVRFTQSPAGGGGVRGGGEGGQQDIWSWSSKRPKTFNDFIKKQSVYTSSIRLFRPLPFCSWSCSKECFDLWPLTSISQVNSEDEAG